MRGSDLTGQTLVLCTLWLPVRHTLVVSCPARQTQHAKTLSYWVLQQHMGQRWRLLWVLLEVARFQDHFAKGPCPHVSQVFDNVDLISLAVWLRGL